MNRIIIACLAACICLSCTSQSEKPENGTMTLKIIETTDIHGCFLAYDFLNDRPLKGSMGKVATYVDSIRNHYGDNLILLDNGDILQGQPTNYYYNYVKTDVKNIATEILNHLRYDAVSPGNHDIETGHAVYDKWINETDCPIIAANMINVSTGKPYTTPYIILERQGVRVAILGMITPAIPNWLNEKLWEGMRFESIYDSSKQWIKHLKDTEKADIIIGLFHCGWSGGITTETYKENEAERVAKEVPGFDAILFGHDHSKRLTKVVNTDGDSVLCINPANNAQAVGEVTIDITFKDGKIAEKNIKGEIISVTDFAVCDAFTKKFTQHSDDIKSYATRVIGNITENICTADCYFGSSAFCDLIHNLQLSITGADISLCAPLSFNATIEAGPITISDMFKLYKYENNMCVLKMTGKEVRNLLEMSYAIWTNTMSSPDDHIMLLDEKETADSHRYYFKNPTFNFDSAAGIDYEVDVTKPIGSKVNILRMSNGTPFEENATYKVVTNSYRANGGGELMTKGADIPQAELVNRIIYQSERDQRHLLSEEIERLGTITPKANDNWRFIPTSWTENAIKRDRKYIFGK